MLRSARSALCPGGLVYSCSAPPGVASKVAGVGRRVLVRALCAAARPCEVASPFPMLRPRAYCPGTQILQTAAGVGAAAPLRSVVLYEDYSSAHLRLWEKFF